MDLSPFIIGFLGADLALSVLILGAAIWLAIHSREWRVAQQAQKVRDHDAKIEFLLTVAERIQTNQHTLTVEAAKASTKIWEELKLISGRLDRMQCPMQHADCPLNDPVSREIWTREKREEFRRAQAEKQKEEEGA